MKIWPCRFGPIFTYDYIIIGYGVFAFSYASCHCKAFWPCHFGLIVFCKLMLCNLVMSLRPYKASHLCRVIWPCHFGLIALCKLMLCNLVMSLRPYYASHLCILFGHVTSALLRQMYGSENLARPLRPYNFIFLF